jgi:hypothetical protein
MIKVGRCWQRISRATKKARTQGKKKKKKKGGHRQNWVGSMVGKNTFEKDVGNNEVH